LIGVLILTLSIELVGVKLSQSLALSSDAGHLSIDLTVHITSLIVALKVYFGGESKVVRRVGLAIHILLLFFIAAVIGIEAFERLETGGYHIEPKTAILFSVIGGLGNFWQYRLSGGAHSHNETHTWLNIHILIDLFYSGVAATSAFLTDVTGLQIIDPIASMILAAFLVGFGLIAIYNIVAKAAFFS